MYTTPAQKIIRLIFEVSPVSCPAVLSLKRQGKRDRGCPMKRQQGI